MVVGARRQVLLLPALRETARRALVARQLVLHRPRDWNIKDGTSISPKMGWITASRRVHTYVGSDDARTPFLLMVHISDGSIPKNLGIVIHWELIQNIFVIVNN